MTRRFTRTLGGILLVSGTTIGAAMLALPVSTGLGGFIPASLLFVLYWALMTYTAFLFLEVNLWLGAGVNFTTMVRATLGHRGEVVSWFLYLFLLYSLMTAYIAGGGPIFNDTFMELTGIALPQWVGAFPFLGVLGYFVFKGTRSVDLFNRVLMCGLVVTFVIMIGYLTPHVNPKLLTHIEIKSILLGVSVIATSFGCHIIIPSLVPYLNSDIKLLKRVLLIGGAIPLLVYLIWEYVALGIIPVGGPNSIAEGYVKGSNGVHLMSATLGHDAIAVVALFFSFFAIVTSFLGISLSLFDFLSDGLKISKSITGRLWLYFLTFIPPLVISLLDPRAFLSALEYAGAFGVMSLLAILPASMVWGGRYYKHLDKNSTFRVPGGKIALVTVIVMSLIVIALEICVKLNVGDINSVGVIK